MAAFRCTGRQHNFALGGSITLHWVAELIAFSNNPAVHGGIMFTYLPRSEASSLVSH
jgi:hypothetical protein